MTLPLHVAIIMDGNGRWANERDLPRSSGHKAGVNRLKDIIHHANKRNLKYLTLFAFSSENWKRPQKEVNYLLELLEFFIKQDLKKIHEQNICIKILGDRLNLNSSLIKLIDEAENLTCENTNLCLNVAFNYGSRNEITRAFKLLIQDIESQKIELSNLTNETISLYLDTKNCPDPDLIIRTGGEQRLSNFLLWQSAYSELYFCNSYWPDFSVEDFDKALSSYAKRERRYGKVKNVQ